MSATNTEAPDNNTESVPTVYDEHGKPTQIEPTKLVYAHPCDLKIHPVLDRFPRMGKYDLILLRVDIAEKRRVLTPVLADTDLRVYDGRHRTEIAQDEQRQLKSTTDDN